MGVEEWKECKLGEICTKITDGSHFSPQACQTGYPMFSVKDMLEYRFDYSNCKHISAKDFESMKNGDCVPQKGDILVAKDGSFLKQIFECKETKEEAILSSIAMFRPNQDFITPTFLCYLLKSPKVYNYIASNCVSGYALPRIVLKDFKKVSMQVPPLPTQQKIADILSSLDDKIELNNKINTNLEQQAQALFKNWFVDCMNSTTKMSDIIDVRDGTHDSPKPQESGYLLVTSKHLEAYSINPTDANFITKEDYDKINERSKVDNGDILLSMIGTVGIVSLVIDNPVTWAIKNMGLFKTSKVEDLKYYLLNYLKSDDVRNYIEQHLAGSTQKYISLSELRNLPINIPEKNILEKFNNIVTPIYEQIVNNTNEIKNLKELRDTLLPKLMNGEIEV